MAATAQQVIQAAVEHERCGRTSEAEQLYSLLIEQLAAYPAALYQIGLLAQQAGLLQTAKRFLAKAIERAPEVSEYRAGLANALWQFGEPEAALDHALKAAQLDPRRAEAQSTLGNILATLDRFEAAIAAYRRAVELKPDNTEAWNNLGVALSKAGETTKAIEAYRRALEWTPDHAEVLNNLAAALLNEGRPDEAAAACRRSLELRPNFPEAEFNFANALRDLGQKEEAVAAYRRSLALRPNDAETRFQLGVVLKEQGLIDEAIASWRKSVELRPDDFTAHFNLGMALGEKEAHAEAAEAYRRASLLRPDDADTMNNLGRELIENGDREAGIEACRSATVLRPTYAAAFSNIGKALRDIGRLDEAIVASKRAIELQSNFPEAENNLANCYNDLLELGTAVEHYKRAISQRSDYALPHVNLGMVELLRGNLAAGWPEYEWRLKDRPRKIDQPLWDGSDLNHRIIFVHAEQGAGDTLQFVRYVPQVAARNGRVILECQGELVRLLQSVKGAEWVRAAGTEVPAFSVHCPLLSLPRIFGTEIDTIPKNVPYVSPPADMLARWRGRLGNENELLVGLNWAGNPEHENDRNRSISAEMFARLAEVPGVQFVSLQKGAAANAGEVLARNMNVLRPEIGDFADTAALMSQLDLIITVDTSVAHLAGALGKPAWVMLTKTPDWRWMLQREDSPWYPSLRLFRQPRAGDWESVLRCIHAELVRLVQTRTRPT